MLLDNLKAYDRFQQLTNTQKEIFARLALQFEEHSEQTIFLTPTQLTEALSVGNKEQWRNFLSFEPVKHFIDSELREFTKINQRIGLKQLSEETKSGDVQAIKHLDQVAGIFDKQDSNKVIILHQISRPNAAPQENQTKETQEESSKE